MRLRPFSGSTVTGSILIIVFILSIRQAYADPYYCATGSLCLLATVNGPIALCDGETVDLYARPTGFFYPLPPSCTNPTYQWYREIDYGGIVDYVAINGATNNVFTVGTAGRYYCRVGCSNGDYSTSLATILVNSPGTALTINTNPQPEATCLGDQAVFEVSASGGGISYHWQEQSPGGSWKNLLTQTSNTLTLNPDLADDMNLYRCKVSNGCETTTTSTAELTVNTAPEIMSGPVNDSVCEDAAAGFSVSVSGAEQVYDWQERISGSDPWQDLSSSGNYNFDQSGNLTISSASATMEGYQYRAVVTGLCAPGVDTSLAAAIHIKAPPSVLVQPISDTTCVGDTAIFEVQAEGNVPLSYKWQKGGRTVKDWSSEAFLSIPDASLDDNQEIQVFISDQCFSTSNPVSSDIARLVVNRPPTVNLGPDKTICSGTIAVLNAGKGTSFLWSNGDSTKYTEVSQQGSYSVSVTDSVGCTGEDMIFVIVDPPVGEVHLGPDTTFCKGSQITLDAGTGFDWYEWSDGSSNQSNMASATGEYWVKAGNSNTICTSTDTISVLVSEPFDSTNICLITVDPATGRFIVIWERTPDKGIAAYNIYREGNLIGSVAFDGLSVFKDLEADPEKRPYRYEMTIIDTCGNESGFTPYHIPIFLQYSGFIDGVNLTWEKYQVEGRTIDFNSYTVYKGSDSTQLVELEENIPPEVSVFIDKDPSALTNAYYYRVAGVLSEPCNASGGSEKAGTGPYTHSLSNLDDNKLLLPSGIRNVGGDRFSIYPNPAAESANIRFNNPSKDEFVLLLTDLTGKVLRIFKNITADEFTFGVDDLIPGYYQVILQGPEVYRGRLIVK